jgi:LPXTG-site transpeptidase (sortase) family protein
MDRLLEGHNRKVTLIGALLAVVLLAFVGLVVACGGGDDDGGESEDGTPTAGASATPRSTRTPVSGGERTPIAFVPAAELTLEDLAMRGAGEPARGDFRGERLIIPKINVDAPFTYKLVGPDGRMPNPEGAGDVAYYDFAQWPGMGGLPGAGGNVVVAGHVDYINVGPAVFWDLETLQPGDIVTVRLNDGTEVNYAIEFNKWVDPTFDWSLIVGATGDESITLITCTGEFSGGQYTQRQVAWGRKV